MRHTILVLLSVLFVGVAAAAPPPPPNVLLICVDDLRPELNHLGATHIHSPNIDRLAAAGRSFRRHYVNAPSCGPSRFSMLTGLYPVKGRQNEHLTTRAKQLAQVAQDAGAYPPSMPEWFRRRGYTTVSVGKVSHHPGGRYGEGWAHAVRRHYAACVSYVDQHVSEIMARLQETGADQNTVVVLWGDHGWHLGEHDIWGKHSLFEESLHAPLIVFYPGMPQAGQTSDAVAETNLPEQPRG